MTCQYGWPADTTCNAWDSPFHGCDKPPRHPGECACKCGDTRLMYRDQRKNRGRDRGKAA